MKILCQRDLRWKDRKIGASDLSLGDYGCTTTGLAEVNNKFGANCTPLDVANHEEFYTLTGLVLWTKIDMKFALPEASPRVYGCNLARITDSLSLPNKAVLLEVQLSKTLKHWLFGEAIGYNNQIYARDPWDGTLVDILYKYGKITGSAHFLKK
nr:MAG: hypothetical protein [Podoviridae sp. ctka020]